jgi:hypothetical protein
MDKIFSAKIEIHEIHLVDLRIGDRQRVVEGPGVAVVVAVAVHQRHFRQAAIKGGTRTDKGLEKQRSWHHLESVMLARKIGPCVP